MVDLGRHARYAGIAIASRQQMIDASFGVLAQFQSDGKNSREDAQSAAIGEIRCLL